MKAASKKSPYKGRKESNLSDLFVIYFKNDLSKKAWAGLKKRMKEISCFFILTVIFLFAKLFNDKSKQFRFV